jgi:hypothetical protein
VIPKGRCLDRAREGREPDALRCRVCINDVVRAGAAFERHCRCRGGILDMDPAPHALAITDHRDPLLADLVTHIPVIVKPGARAIEEAVTQTDKCDAGCGQCRGFELVVAARAGGDRWPTHQRRRTCLHRRGRHPARTRMRNSAINSGQWLGTRSDPHRAPSKLAGRSKCANRGSPEIAGPREADCGGLGVPSRWTLGEGQCRHRCPGTYRCSNSPGS